MKRTIRIVAKDFVTRVEITAKIDTGKYNFVGHESQRHTTKVVNSLHAALRNHYDAAEIKIK